MWKVASFITRSWCGNPLLCPPLGPSLSIESLTVFLDECFPKPPRVSTFRNNVESAYFHNTLLVPAQPHCSGHLRLLSHWQLWYLSLAPSDISWHLLQDILEAQCSKLLSIYTTFRSFVKKLFPVYTFKSSEIFPVYKSYSWWSRPPRPWWPSWCWWWPWPRCWWWSLCLWWWWPRPGDSSSTRRRNTATRGNKTVKLSS